MSVLIPFILQLITIQMINCQSLGLLTLGGNLANMASGLPLKQTCQNHAIPPNQLASIIASKLMTIPETVISTEPNYYMSTENVLPKASFIHPNLPIGRDFSNLQGNIGSGLQFLVLNGGNLVNGIQQLHDVVLPITVSNSGAILPEQLLKLSSNTCVNQLNNPCNGFLNFIN